MKGPDIHQQRAPQLIDVITESEQDQGTGEINKEPCIHISQSVLPGNNHVAFEGQRPQEPMNGTSDKNESFQGARVNIKAVQALQYKGIYQGEYQE